MTNQTFAYNPEIKGQMGLELPQLDTNFREAFEKPMAILGTVASLAGGIAVGVNSLSHPEKANAGVEICTTPTGEVPVARNVKKFGAVDLMTYTPALSNRLCVGNETKVTTYIENIGTATAKSVRFSVTGKSYIINTLSSVSINDKPIQIIESGKYPATGEYCEWYRFAYDRAGKKTSGLNCIYGLYPINLPPNDKIKVDFLVKPAQATKANEVGGDNAIYANAPYIEVDALDKVSPESIEQDKNLDNNYTRRDVIVRDANGNSVFSVGSGGTGTANKCIALGLALKVPAKTTKGKGVLTTIASTKTGAIRGTGNGASKNAKIRAKAARIQVSTTAKTGKLPNDMLRVGNNIFIDIPKSGVKLGKSVVDRIPFKFSGKSAKFSAMFIAPKGTIANCDKAMTVSSKPLNSTAR